MIVEVPRKLYKFMNSDFLRLFTSGKSIKVGSLKYYQNTELHELNKGDDLEGAIAFKAAGNIWDSDTSSNKALMTEMGSRGMGTTSNVQIMGTKYPLLVSSQNAYVFSLSTEFNPEIAADLAADYDVCVEIGDPRVFVKTFLQTIAKRLGPSTTAKCAPVVYKPRVYVEPDYQIDPSPFVKDSRFALQKEYRIVCPSEKAEIEDSLILSLPSYRMRGCNFSAVWRRP